MIFLLTLIKSYPLSLTKLEKHKNTTLAYLEIDCPTNYELSLEYNPLIEDLEKWENVCKIQTYSDNNSNQIVVEMNRDLEDGYYTFKLKTDDYFTYCQPIEKIDDVFYNLETDYTKDLSKINKIKDNIDEDDKSKKDKIDDDNIKDDKFVSIGKYRWNSSHLFGFLFLIIILLCLICIFSQRNNSLPNESW